MARRSHLVQKFMFWQPLLVGYLVGHGCGHVRPKCCNRLLNCCACSTPRFRASCERLSACRICIHVCTDCRAQSCPTGAQNFEHRVPECGPIAHDDPSRIYGYVPPVVGGLVKTYEMFRLPAYGPQSLFANEPFVLTMSVACELVIWQHDVPQSCSWPPSGLPRVHAYMVGICESSGSPAQWRWIPLENMIGLLSNLVCALGVLLRNPRPRQRTYLACYPPLRAFWDGIMLRVLLGRTYSDCSDRLFPKTSGTISGLLSLLSPLFRSSCPRSTSCPSGILCETGKSIP